MNVLIQITYKTLENSILQKGSFPLKGHTPEQVAYDFLRQIKRKMAYYQELEQVLADNVDITDKVKEIDKTSLN